MDACCSGETDLALEVVVYEWFASFSASSELLCLVKEADVLAFLSATVKSLWALELLLLMRRERTRAWQMGALVTELRASTVVVHDALGGLIGAGLAAEDDAGSFCYRPASDTLDSFVAEAQALYAAKPLAVINAIAAAPNEKLRIFADAFRLKD